MTFLSVFTIVTLSLVTGTALAKEGFSTNPELLPPPVRDAWNSTFSIVVTSPKMHIGTAFLIYKEKIGGQLELYFATSDHNIINCQPDQICPNHILMQDAIFKETPEVIQFNHRGLRFNKVILGTNVAEPKISILKVTVPPGTIVPEPVRMAGNCEIKPGTKLYGIGWPDTSSRVSPAQGTIQDPKLGLKRWSEGIFLDYFKMKSERFPLLGSTVDNLIGMSGGPITLEDGTVVSLFQKSVTTPGSAYDGVDDINGQGFQTLGTHCEFIKSIRDTFAKRSM